MAPFVQRLKERMAQRRSSRLAMVVVLVLVPSSGGTLQAQTLSFFKGNASVEHPELGEPSEFGIALTVDVASRVFLRAAYTSFASSSDRIGEICTWYEPPRGCGPEAIHGESSLGGISLSALPYVQIFDGVRLGVGGGISLNHLDSRIDGESGRIAWAFIPRGGQVGGVALASLRLGPLDGIPFTVAVNATRHWVNLDGCVAEPTRYDPFCGTQRFQTLELEVGYALTFLAW